MCMTKQDYRLLANIAHHPSPLQIVLASIQTNLDKVFSNSLNTAVSSVLLKLYFPATL
jgi:hypothetical protein